MIFLRNLTEDRSPLRKLSSQKIIKSRSIFTQAFSSKASKGFNVEITAEVINVRTGSAIGFEIVTTLRKGDKVKISEVLEDGWGRLASGAGYINLIFTKRI